MYKTIEAVMDNGSVEPVEGSLPKTRTRVLITVLGSVRKKTHSFRLSDLQGKRGLLSRCKRDPVKIQRQMRDEW